LPRCLLFLLLRYATPPLSCFFIAAIIRRYFRHFRFDITYAAFTILRHYASIVILRYAASLLPFDGQLISSDYCFLSSFISLSLLRFRH